MRIQIKYCILALRVILVVDCFKRLPLAILYITLENLRIFCLILHFLRNFLYRYLIWKFCMFCVHLDLVSRSYDLGISCSLTYLSL